MEWGGVGEAAGVGVSVGVAVGVGVGVGVGRVVVCVWLLMLKHIPCFAQCHTSVCNPHSCATPDT